MQRIFTTIQTTQYLRDISLLAGISAILYGYDAESEKTNMSAV